MSFVNDGWGSISSLDESLDDKISGENNPLINIVNDDPLSFSNTNGLDKKETKISLWESYLNLVKKHRYESSATIAIFTALSAVFDSLSGIPVWVSLKPRIFWGVTNYSVSVPLGFEGREKSLDKQSITSGKGITTHDAVLGFIGTCLVKFPVLYYSYILDGKEPDLLKISIATGISAAISIVATPLITLTANVYDGIRKREEHPRTPEWLKKYSLEERKDIANKGITVAAGVTTVAYAASLYFNGF